MKSGIVIVHGRADLTGLCMLRSGGWELILVGVACIVSALLYTILA